MLIRRQNIFLKHRDDRALLQPQAEQRLGNRRCFYVSATAVPIQNQNLRKPEMPSTDKSHYRFYSVSSGVFRLAVKFRIRRADKLGQAPHFSL